MEGAWGGSEVAAQSSWPCWGRGWPWITCGEMVRAPDTCQALGAAPVSHPRCLNAPPAQPGAPHPPPSPPTPSPCPHPVAHGAAAVRGALVCRAPGALRSRALVLRTMEGTRLSPGEWHGWRPAGQGSPWQLTGALIAGSTVGPCQGRGWVRRGSGEALGEVRGAVVGPQGKGGNEDIGYRI